MFRWLKRRRRVTERDVLTALYYEVLAMSLNYEKLNAAVARSTKLSELLLAHLVASQPDPSVEVANQVALDNSADVLNAESDKVEASLPPAEPPPPAVG